MAETNAVAAWAALLFILQIWESLINGKYMNEAYPYNKPPCPTCGSTRECNNHFCLQCRSVGLCPMAFREDQEHHHHPWLQVRRYTRQYSVLSTDLAHFIGEDELKHIHTYAGKPKQGHRHCMLTSKNFAESSSSREKPILSKVCGGCQAILRGSKDSTETFLVCSLQCLMKAARTRSEWDLLAMKVGALEPMHPPLTCAEKRLRPPRMLDTPIATPIGEAPPSPQAPADSPVPQSPEDFPQDIILDVVDFSCKPDIDDCFMIASLPGGTLGEAHLLPPAIEDFRATPPESPELERSFSDEFSDLDELFDLGDINV